MSNNEDGKKFQFKPIMILPMAIILIIIIGIILFMVLGNKMTPQKLFEENFSGQHLASTQHFDGILDVDENNDNKIEISLEDRRDADTDHVKAKNVTPNEFAYEVYVSKIDLKYGVYYKKDGDDKWNLSYKTKNISEDDVRTDYVEKDNEINLTDVNINSFSNVDISKEDDCYVVTGQTNYITTLAILSNIRQVLGVNENYAKYSNFFTKSASELKVDVTMKFDKKTKLLKSVNFKSDEDSLKKCIDDFKEVEDISLKQFNYTLVNDSYDPSDIYVPSEVDLKSVKADE